MALLVAVHPALEILAVWVESLAGRRPSDTESCAVGVLMHIAGWVLIWRRAVRWTRTVSRWTGAAAAFYAISAIGATVWSPEHVWTGAGAWLGAAVWIAATGIIWTTRSAQPADIAEHPGLPVRCPACGHDLTEIRRLDCPACGVTLDLGDLVARALLELSSRKRAGNAAARASGAAD